jgi:hypothetical protein
LPLDGKLKAFDDASELRHDHNGPSPSVAVME